MNLTNAEKRALEIYFILLVSKMRENNPRAINILHNFLKSMSFFGNYNPNFIFDIIINYIEDLSILPKPIEMTLMVYLESNKLHFIKKNLKFLYKKPIPTAKALRYNEFSANKVTLYPKIHIQNFHEQLLTFLRDFAIIAKTSPIK